MVKICPVVDFSINKKVARLNALFTLIALVLFVFTDIKYPLFILVLDFFTRAFLKGKYSIISFLSKSLLRILKIEPEMINAGAKMFAARLGFLFCFLISVFYLLNIINVANTLSLIVMVLASLEFFLDFCMGCTIYSFLRSIGL